MSENLAHRSPKNVKKKATDFSNQSRLTTFFKPSPEAHLSRKDEEEMQMKSVFQGKVIKKRIINDFPTKEVKREPVKTMEVIAIDSDSSSHQDSNWEDSSPSPKKLKLAAKVAKRPMTQTSTLMKTSKSIKVPEPPLKKPGLMMRTNHVPSTSVRLALEEKKNFNADTSRRVVVCPDVPDMEVDLMPNSSRDKSLKRSQSFNSSQDDWNEDSRSFPNSPSNPKRNKSSRNEKNENLSDRSLEKHPKRSKLENAKNNSETSKTRTENALFAPNKKKRSGSPVPFPVALTTKKSLSENSKKELTEMNACTKTISIKSNCQAKSAEVPQKTLMKNIVRRSAIRSSENPSLSINSKVVVNLEEITSGVTVAFQQTYKDLETLLDMQLGTRFCSNLQMTMDHPRNLLANSFRTNFNFFMNRKDKDTTKDCLEALGSLRCISRYQYPHPDVLHTIIHQIMKNAKDHVVLQRAKELVYKMLSLHPPGDINMRKYYWSVISPNFDDIDLCSRWENVRCLLDQLLTDDKDIVFKSYSGPGKPPSPSECSKAVLGIIIHILNEDFRCWVMQLSTIAQPAELLQDRNNLPLIARILWPQKTIPHITTACMELISFHLTALKSQPDVLWYTKPLVKMMASVTQLSDLQLPLRFRKPSLYMIALAREVLARSEKFSNSYALTFGSTELSLLLPLMAVNKANPQIVIPDGKELNLTWMLNSFLKIKEKTDKEVVAEFGSRPLTERQAFLSALSAYFKLSASYGTWFYLRNKYRESRSRVYAPEQQPLKLAITPMFSKTFSSEQLMDDLRQTKRLLHSEEKQKSLYFYLSSVSW